MELRFRKVKVTNDHKISILFERKTKGENWDEYSMSCSEEPRPEFFKALTALAPHVIEMSELPESYVGRITVRGVSFSYGGEKEVMGATISAQMDLLKSNCNLNLNTPHKASESYSESDADPKQLLTGDCVDDLYTLQEEAEKYINGDRAQTKLFAA